MINIDHIKKNCDLSKVKTIVEIGTGSGELAEFILTNQRSLGIVDCEYYGFDVFEDYGTSIPGISEEIADTDKNYRADVSNKLRNFCDNITLHKGRSVDTLTGFTNTFTKTIDLVIINGSSLEQDILKDFYLTNPLYKNGTVVFFDYTDTGSKSIINGLEWYNLKHLEGNVACITWRQEGEGPIEFISEPGPI